MALRFRNEAPFRCRACGLRFVAKTEPDASSLSDLIPAKSANFTMRNK
ncbi:MAG: hypothetical protein XXXNARYT_001707, partial [Candidatus Accumulibacter regalis]